MDRIAKELIKIADELSTSEHLSEVGVGIDKAGKKIKGWEPYWEYPGFVMWSHPKYDIRVAATPWFNDDNEIDIQIQGDDGDYVDGFSIRFESTGDVKTDINNYFRVMMRAWSKVMKIIDAI